MRFICTRPETTLARYRRLFITFIFIQFSKHSGQEEVSERGPEWYTRLNYEYLCNLRHVRYVRSVQLDLPRLTSSLPVRARGQRHRRRCGCPFGNPSPLPPTSSSGQGYLCRKISTAQTYVMSFLCYTGRILRAPADARTLGEVLPARVRCCVQRTISLKSAQISYFVLTVPSYPDQVPVTPIKVEWSGDWRVECACIPHGVRFVEKLTAKRHLF